MIRNLDKVLVTGGAGFIGSHLVDELVNEGFEVTVLDNLSTGNLENIKSHLNRKSIHFVEGDIRNKRNTEAALKDVKALFHLAAVVSVPFSVKYPKETSEVNIKGTQNLLETSIRNGVEKFIYVSTCAVYGNPLYVPVDEKHPTNPESPYAKTKLKAEQECIKLSKTHRISTTILRLFNVYGPKQRFGDYGGVMAQFVNQLRNDKPLTIYGDGLQTRDFIHVNDVAKALVLALKETETSDVQIFNIASGKPTTINDLAQLLIDLLESKQTKPKHVKPRKGDVKHSYANIKKAETSLNFKPKIPLKEGLSTLI